MFWKNKEQDLIRKTDHYGRLQFNRGKSVDIMEALIQAENHYSIEGMVASNLIGSIAAYDSINLVIGTPFHPEWHDIPTERKVQRIPGSSFFRSGNSFAFPDFYFPGYLAIQTIDGSVSLKVLDPEVKICEMDNKIQISVSGADRMPQLPARQILVFGQTGKISVSY